MKHTQQNYKWSLTLTLSSLLAILILFAGTAWSDTTAVPPVTLLPLNQLAVPEPPNLFQYVKNKSAAIRLGKALFWEMQVGSDGMTACATCHFSAGTDKRLKNTLNPGTKAGDTAFQVRGPNQTLVPSDFPFHQRQTPTDFKSSPVTRDSNDVVGSQGVRLNQFLNIIQGSAVDNGFPITDSVFTENEVNIRQVTGRNTPSVINAVFNFTNFWDGRASAFFNGSSPFGPLDQSAGAWYNVNGTLTKQPVSLDFASLASQATGPPLSDVEMSFRGRTFPQLGRKMLSLTPLGKQTVHPDDSELGNISRATLQPDGTVTGPKGLSASYSQMIKDAFQNNLWNSNLTTLDGYNQMEANFALFWGLAIQLYEATLVSDDTPFDRFLGGDSSALTSEQQDGFNLFFGAGRCDACHGATELTNASVRAGRFITNAEHGLLEVMPVASGQQIVYDNGFNNTAVRPTTEDVCRADLSPFDNPLTGTKFPLSFSDLAELQAQAKLPFETPILVPGLPATFPVANKGAFKVPGLRNIELTAPYMHNGSMMTLEEVVDFYARGGNFPAANKADLDINIVELPALQGEPAAKAALVDFMKSMTDERVRHEEAPFDHPEIFIPNGDSASDTDLIHLTATGTFGQVLPATAVTLSSDLASPQITGTAVTFSARGAGGNGYSYVYEYWLHDGTSWSKVQPYSDNGNWLWDTSTVPPGIYTLQVNLKSTGSTAAFEAWANAVFQINTAPATGVTLTTDKTSPKSIATPGGVTFSATATGGTGSYEFEFWQHNGASWTNVQPYSAATSWNWDTSTASPGVYTVQVNARSAGSTASFETYNAIVFTLADASSVASATLVPDKISPQSATTPGGVVYTAAGQGGSGSYEYEFYLHNGQGWAKVQNMSINNIWNWDTSTYAPGTYTIQVNVRSLGSTAPYEVWQNDVFTLQ